VADTLPDLVGAILGVLADGKLSLLEVALQRVNVIARQCHWEILEL